MKKIILSLALLLAISPITASAYTVKPGDTLWKIAKANNTTWQQIAEYNNIENPNLIFAGQELFVGQLGAVTPQPRLLGDNTWTGTNTFNGTTTGVFTNMTVVSTTGTSTWAVPAGVTKVKVTVVGGGANGANISGTRNVGGAGGGYAQKIVDVSATSSVLVTVGTVSATSSFSSYVSASGGVGQVAGTGIGGDINISGERGGNLWDLSGTGFIMTGKGGNSFMGSGGERIIGSTGTTANGLAGSGYGAGGSGCSGKSSGSEACTGGAGTQGIVIIEY